MSSSCNSSCLDAFGCPDPSSGICPDFRIKRHDTKPDFEIIVTDCGEPLNLEDTVVEVSMWANAKLKAAIDSDDTYFGLADNIGFQQALVGDIIIIADQIRAPEQMLVTGFDESNKLIRVERGYHGTAIRSYKKGTKIKIFRFIGSVGETEMTTADILQVDGTTEEDVLTQSKLIYVWNSQDTCVPGCFYLEFKLLKMASNSSLSAASSLMYAAADLVPSFTTPSASDLGCSLGDGVEWVRRFPVEKAGYLIQIVDSPTSESLT